MGSQKYPKFCTQSEEQSKLLWSQDYHRPRFKKLTSWGLQRLSACQRLSSGSKAITKRRRPSLSQQVWNVSKHILIETITRVVIVYAYIYIYIFSFFHFTSKFLNFWRLQSTKMLSTQINNMLAWLPRLIKNPPSSAPPKNIIHLRLHHNSTLAESDDGVLKCTQLIVETSLSLEMAFSEIVVDACFAIPWNPGKMQTAWSGHNHIMSCDMCYVLQKARVLLRSL